MTHMIDAFAGLMSNRFVFEVPRISRMETMRRPCIRWEYRDAAKDTEEIRSVPHVHNVNNGPVRDILLDHSLVPIFDRPCD
jgi:hypothetical protein